jgi:hypothetical protein
VKRAKNLELLTHAASLPGHTYFAKGLPYLSSFCYSDSTFFILSFFSNHSFSFFLLFIFFLIKKFCLGEELSFGQSRCDGASTTFLTRFSSK